jgi:hypothetical protein
MKKIFSIGFFVMGIVILSIYYIYISNPQFNYLTAQFIAYLFYWSVAVFIVSLFALVIDKIKYKKWLLITLVYVLISLIFGYKVGDGNGGIIDIDGQSLTFLLAGFYSFISIIYFLIHFFKNRKKVA